MLHWIDESTPLPPTHLALGPDSDAPGLLAAGGRVTPQRLIEAYSQGIFPWYSQGQPVLWWTPDPRMVLQTAHFRVSRSLHKTLRRFLRDSACTVRFDSAFETVMHHCAQAPRQGQHGTWILPAMVDAYVQGHKAGFVHSAETWVGGQLVGGLYFVSLGRMCFGESMFAHQTDASKIALVALVAACRARGVPWIDCQQKTAHLASMGAFELPRATFEAHLHTHARGAPVQKWSYDEVALADWLNTAAPSA
jgi:leucyl/phenylalanyl-tRNA---protein transferase